MGLVEFLRARLDEDGRIAKDASVHVIESGTREESLFEAETNKSTVLVVNPSRVLAEVEAKRRIVATFAALDTHPNRLVYAFMQQQWVALRAVMAALALPYADHPDYLAKWKP